MIKQSRQMSKIALLIVLLLRFTNTNAHTMRFESNIPDVGQEGQFIITNETERIMGKIMMHRINASGYVSEDIVVQEYVATVGHRLMNAGPTPAFKLNYFPMQSRELNAFAFFGGNIAVNTGLILKVDCESELAAVLAHETAHVTQRHLARILTQQKRFTPVTMLELLAALAVGALGSPDAGIGLATAAMGNQVQRLINFTRDHEYEADRMGIQTLSKAGYDPMALPGVFKKLSTATRYNEKPPEYLLTHPVFETRIADAYNRAEKLPYTKISDGLFFHLVRARIEADSTDKVQVYLNHCKTRLNASKTENNMVSRYAYALALAKARKYDEARALMLTLVEEMRDSQELWIVKYSLSEIEYNANHPQEAIAQLEILYQDYPSHTAIPFLYAEALSEDHQYEKARLILLKLKQKQPENLQLYLDLAKVNSKLKKPAEVHRAQAEWHFLRGEYPKTLQQLELAIEKSGNDSRLKEEINFRKNSVQAWISKEKELKL